MVISGHRKGQSIAAYFVTYGWAILIICVIIAAMYQLGAFNVVYNNPGRTVKAGVCQVTRPLGPDTIQGIGLVGICSGTFPQSVATLESAADSSIVVTNLVPPSFNNGFTISAWVEYSSNTVGCGNDILTIVNKTNSSQFINLRGSCGSGPQPSIVINTSYTYALNSTFRPQLGKWVFVAATWNPQASYNNTVIYINGTVSAEGEGPTSLEAYQNAIAFIGGFGSIFDGSIANVQVYNTSFTANDVQRIYREGIGGVPINLSKISAWWQLNGDIADYSGNNNNARSTGVAFSQNWAAGYITPH